MTNSTSSNCCKSISSYIKIVSNELIHGTFDYRRAINIDDALPDAKVSIIQLNNETLRVRKLNDDLLVSNTYQN